MNFLPKAGQASQSFVQAVMDKLQGRRLYTLSGQPIALLGFAYGEKISLGSSKSQSGVLSTRMPITEGWRLRHADQGGDKFYKMFQRVERA